MIKSFASIVVFSILLSCFGHPSFAQQRRLQTGDGSDWSESEQRQAIDKIVKTAKTAVTIDDFTRILIETRDVYQRPLTPANRKYLRKLIAWLNVSRGEKHAERAALASEKGKHVLADDLERKALKDFTRAIASTPSWRAYHNRGVSHAMLGEYEQAMDDFDVAIRENEKPFGSTHFNRAEILFELQRFEDAAKDYQLAYRLDKNDVDALSGYAHSLFYMDKVESALKAFDRIIQLENENAAAYTDRGDVYAYLGEWEKAARDFKVAIKLDNTLGRAFRSAAWLMATCPEAKIRNPKLAVKAANRAIALDGDTADFRYLDTLAAAQAASQDFQAAQSTIRQALRQAPEEMFEELKSRLVLYQAGRPFKDVVSR